MHIENADNSLPNVLQLAQQEAYKLLTINAAEPGFSNILRQSFGSSYDSRTAEALIQRWKEGNFHDLPNVQIQNLDQLDKANGAFASSTQTIYVSDNLLQQAQASCNIAGVVGVLLEEVGHFVDDLINPVDSAGDEGEIFSALVRGISLSGSELSALYTDNDQAVINLGGEEVTVEMSQTAQAVFNGRLYQSHRGQDNRIYTRYSLDSLGTSWSAWDEDGGATLSAPDLQAFNGRLYQVHRGTDNQIYLRYSTDALATNWSGWRQFGGTTTSAPTLEVFNNRLFM
ncbi:hypothetical protein ACQ4M4_28240, partial [Leptolyngbya sp. AN02str]|uniref:hypothetical protein n=1 Tax=Leptolyngbya sp. AN02str TaxID=3423363 RepID=UPI003D31464F